MTDHSTSLPSDWNWLKDTYWYVLPENLSALRFDPDNDSLNWVSDQTVWHITGYENGYFWGVSATVIKEKEEQPAQHRRGLHPVCFAMLGTITPQGSVHLTFILSKASSSRSATTGVGRAMEYRNEWRLEMQMSSGNDDRTAHWAYMTRTQPGESSWESLPGAGISVPDMLEGCELPQPSWGTQ